MLSKQLKITRTTIFNGKLKLRYEITMNIFHVDFPNQSKTFSKYSSWTGWKLKWKYKITMHVNAFPMNSIGPQKLLNK